MDFEKLVELNSSELREPEGDYKYVITTFEDISRIQYYEKENKEYKLIESFELPSCHDIQVCEKIIELRKAYKE